MLTRGPVDHAPRFRRMPRLKLSGTHGGCSTGSAVGRSYLTKGVPCDGRSSFRRGRALPSLGGHPAWGDGCLLPPDAARANVRPIDLGRSEAGRVRAGARRVRGARSSPRSRPPPATHGPRPSTVDRRPRLGRGAVAPPTVASTMEWVDGRSRPPATLTNSVDIDDLELLDVDLILHQYSGRRFSSNHHSYDRF